MKTIFEKLIAISFIVTACLLFLAAWPLMAWSIWNLLIALIYSRSISEGLLNMISVVVIAMAVIEVDRYIIEEEILSVKNAGSAEPERNHGMRSENIYNNYYFCRA